MLKSLVLAAQKSRLADITSFARYSFKRGRDWFLRNRRLPRTAELRRLFKRAVFEYQIRRPQGLNDLPCPAGFELPESLDPYQCWIAANQQTKQTIARLRDRLNQCSGSLPKISVLMPVYNPPPKFFEVALASVRNQIYENWELCIADDASTEPWVRPRLQELASEDPRIRVCFRERNGNISLASNSAAALATGDFFLFLDQDDLLTHDALAEVALHLSEHDMVDVLYSDDDKIDTEGNRFAPQFKPDWSPELLLSYMYLSHLLVVRKALFEQVNGFRPGFEGSQDYDLALRVTERARSVAHLPYILYHWRVLRGSTAARGDAKPASFDAGRRAVAEALMRRGMRAKVFRPDWAVKDAIGVFWHEFPDDGPFVSILIPTKNQKKILERCINSLKKTTYRNYEVVIIDNGTDDLETLNYLASLKHRVLKIQNPMGQFNFAYINNRAADQVNSDYVLFLNNDTNVRNPKWLSRMVGYARLPGVGAVGARLLYPDGRIQHAGIIHGYYDGMVGPALKLLPDWHHGYLSYGMVARNYSAVTAACLLTPRQLFLDQEGFDERRFGVAYNDVDYCYRLLDNGYRCVYVPGAELYHHEGFSRGFKDDPREVAAFRRRYSGRTDPYYNPNLSLHNERFEIQPRRLARDNGKRPVRALMCANNLNLEGAPYIQYELTVELSRKNVIQPTVYSPTDGPIRSIYERAGIEVIVRRHPLDTVFEIAEYDRALTDFSEWIEKRGFEVVHGNTLQTFYAIDAAKRRGLPSLWSIKESEPWQSYFNFLLSPLIPKALSCFAYPYRIVFSAHATRGVFERLNTMHNFCIIRDGLDTRRLDESRVGWPREKARNTLHLNENEVMVLLLGTVCDRKGQKDLVQAMTLLEDNVIEKVRLFIVGDRPSLYSSEMRKMVSALPKNRAAKISIIRETQDTATYYSAADIFVCSSRIESYPRVTLEAMAYGLAIISTPVFGIIEQVRAGVNGGFYKPGNAAELASKLSELVLYREKREKYQANARLVLESLPDFNEMINSYAEVFRESVSV
jgi:glycosyltransferase involved in cell wall biosynthesis